ncbi:unnamed protein product, partial [Closterium sp. NIES-54]
MSRGGGGEGGERLEVWVRLAQAHEELQVNAGCSTDRIQISCPAAALGAAATAAAAPGAAAPGAATTAAATTAAAAPGAAATAAAAPGAAASGAVAPTTAAPGAATPAAAAELSLYSGSGLAVAAVVRLLFSPLMQLQRCPRVSLTPQQLREWYASWGCRGGRSGSRHGLREWYAQRDGSRGTASCPYVIRTGARTGQPCGTLGHAESRCFARLSDAWRTKFGDAAELPDWVELLRLRVDIYTIDYDAILTAMYALPTSDEGDCYLCLPPDPGGEAAALGACEAAALGASASAAPGAGDSALSGTASAQVYHTFTLDSGASRSFFRDRTTLTPLSWPVAVSLADPSGGPVLASFSTVLPCPAAPSGTLSGMASRVLVSGLPRSLPPLPPGPAPTCVPCVEGRQRAAPHSSEFPPTEAPLQTLHMDIRAARLQLRESFGSDFPILRLHSDRGGEFSSARLGAFCRAQGIHQTFTLPASPQQNGIAERRIGMVMDVARTSMIHAAAPHFLWPFAVQYAAHQLNLQPRVSLPETSPTLLWTGKVGDASAFR